MKVTNIVLIAVISATLLSSATGRTYYVDPNGKDKNGYSWANAFRSIQKAIDRANNIDIIEVNKGTYYENLVFCPNGPNLRYNVVSTNPDDPNVVAATIIDGNGADVVVRLRLAMTGQFSGFTVTGGSCGIFFEKNAMPVVKNCIIRNNTDAGIGCYQSDATILNSIIRDNGDQGIRAQFAHVIAKNNFIHGHNEGVNIIGPDTNGTFCNNTIVNNKKYGIYSDKADIWAYNNILWNNGDNLSGCTVTYSCVQDINDSNGIGNITANPRFVDSNNLHIFACSPCVNAGNPKENYTGQFDIDREARVLDGRIDIGADEVKTKPADANSTKKR